MTEAGGGQAEVGFWGVIGSVGGCGATVLGQASEGAGCDGVGVRPGLDGKELVSGWAGTEGQSEEGAAVGADGQAEGAGAAGSAVGVVTSEGVGQVGAEPLAGNPERLGSETVGWGDVIGSVCVGAGDGGKGEVPPLG